MNADLPAQGMPSHEVQIVRGTEAGAGKASLAPLIFHIDIRPPKLVQITGSTHNLMVDDAPILLAAAGDNNTVGLSMPVSQKYDAVLGACQFVEIGNVMGSAINDISPLAPINDFLKRTASDRIMKIALLEGPRHGTLLLSTDPRAAEAVKYGSLYHYSPSPEYFGGKDKFYKGNDQFSFEVEANGKRFKVIYSVYVVGNVDEVEARPTNKLCPLSRTTWRISEAGDVGGTETSGTSLDDWLASGELDAFVAAASGVTFSFADLSGAAVGSTEGSAITLDPTAAGYNWFIDPTPADNSEFLPTANPYEWIAKAGTEAADKMDMLSVLLHEYGHALGIEHSANSHDYMATTLAPGVRRLPSADELALMAKLAGDLNGQNALASSNTPDSPSTPLPSLPLGSLFGVALLGRLRRTDYGSWTNTVDDVTVIPQYDIAANPQLGNTGFVSSSPNQADGWATTGTVSFSDGAATLTESATAQTRLNQVFIIGDSDRFLSFTVADLALDDLNGAPDDAFEVALLDANTGLSLLGGTGMTHNDAFLNLQADGRENKAQAVTTIRNADGSRTYLLDLAGIPAGTAVNLAFDLIGFGKGDAATGSPNASHLTIRDLRIGVPQTTDDAVATAEDTPVTIDALDNDLNARQPGFAPVIVAAAAHGTVTLDAAGSFTYTPAANWYGEDSFTYKLSDGVVDSNLATVRVTVSPVNDAPTLSDQRFISAEDTAVTGNVLASAFDVEGDALTAALVAGPTHGRLQLAADGSFSYTPDVNWNGEDAFTVRSNDGELESTLATVHLTVTAVNDAPTIAPRTLTLDEDTALVLDLLYGATDVDGDALSVQITIQAQHGSLAANPDGTWTYTPDANWNGTDRVDYKVGDGETAVDSHITFIVGPVNDAPTLSNQALSGLEEKLEKLSLAPFPSPRR